MKKLLSSAATLIVTCMGVAHSQSYTSFNGNEVIKYPYNIQCAPRKCPNEWLKYTDAQDKWAGGYVKQIPARRGGSDTPQYNFNWVREKAGSSPACIAVPLSGGVWDLRMANQRPKVSGVGSMKAVADTRVNFLLPRGANENADNYLTYLEQVSLSLNVCTVIRTPHSRVVPVF